MKYPTALHFLFLSSMKVTVSTADFLCSNDVLKDITTYFPSGAPGRLFDSCDFNILRLTNFPSGLRTALRELFQLCSDTVA